VRKSASEQTLIGIDRARSELYIDRTRSGDVRFDPRFPGRQAAPLNVRGKLLELHIFVDRCSVEVFANRGERVISDLIFPSPGSAGVELFSAGGDAEVRKLDIWSLKKQHRRREKAENSKQKNIQFRG